MGDLIERRCRGVRYFVNPHAASEIYFDKETLQILKNADCDLSVTGVSLYLRGLAYPYSPILVTWDMTSRCNLSCPFCYIRDNNIEKEISFEEIKVVIDTLVSEGLFEVYMSGGECLLLKDFVPIYKYIKSKGVFVTVFTNGYLINDDILECWKEYPPSSVEITLYNDHFLTNPFQMLLKLRDMGIFVLPKYTLTKTTLEYYENVEKWAIQNNFHLSVDSELYDGVDEAHTGISEMYSLSNEQKKILTPKRYFRGENEIGFRTGFPCKSKKGIAQISPDFTISLCNKMKRRWDLREIDVETSLKELRDLICSYEKAVLHGCGGCGFSSECSMCFANAEMKNGELFVPKGYCQALKNKCLV